MAEAIKSKIPPGYLGGVTDQALFYLLAGARGVRVAQCGIQHNIHYLIHPHVGIIMVSLAILSLSGFSKNKWLPIAIASVPPMLFLWLIATDMSRWVAFAILSVWLVCAVRQNPAFEQGLRGNWGRVACALAVLVLVSPVAHVSMAQDVPSPLVEKGVEHFLGPNSFRPFDECDPTWRSVLGG
jgi:hypothetical protein